MDSSFFFISLGSLSTEVLIVSGASACPNDPPHHRRMPAQLGESSPAQSDRPWEIHNNAILLANIENNLEIKEKVEQK